MACIAVFKTILKCDEEKPNKLFIYAPFPIPKHIAGLIPHELIRLNERISINPKSLSPKNEDEYSIFDFTDCEFETTPSTNEIKDLMILTIDVMDNEIFRSLVCAIMEYATYDELGKAMISNAQIKGNEANISMADGYCTLQDKSDGVTSPLYYGLLLMLAILIIENRISQERAQQFLNEQTPLLIIMQEAYNVADDVERDILRKLRYLALYKRTDSDNDSDSMLGRLETMSMIEKDMYSLLYAIENSLFLFIRRAIRSDDRFCCSLCSFMRKETYGRKRTLSLVAK